MYENHGLLTYFLGRVGGASPRIFRVTERKFWSMLSLERAGCLNSQVTPLIVLYIITLSLRKLPEMSSGIGEKGGTIREYWELDGSASQEVES